MSHEMIRDQGTLNVPEQACGTSIVKRSRERGTVITWCCGRAVGTFEIDSDL